MPLFDRYRVAVANDAERARWNDPGWVDSWTRREHLTDAVSPLLLGVAAPMSGRRVCDIGCGAGNLSVALGGLVGPEGDVVGVDISAPLLGLARRRAAGAPRVRFVQRDVQTQPLEEAPFDLAVSQFGVMFFDEPLVAFRAIRGTLRPGGRFVFACWRGVEHNPWHTGAALATLLPPSPTPAPGKSPVGPFALGEDDLVRTLLAGSGFGAVKGASYEISLRSPASAVVDRLQLGFMGIAPEKQEEALELVLGHLAQFSAGDGEYDLPLAFRIYDAEAPR